MGSKIRPNVKAGKRLQARREKAPIWSDDFDPDDAFRVFVSRLRPPRDNREPEPLPVNELSVKLAKLAHEAGSPSAYYLPREPQITVHEILWAMYTALDKGDDIVLKQMHKHAVEYLKTNSDRNFDGATTDVTQRGEFACWLVQALGRIHEPIDRHPVPDPVFEVEPHVRIGWAVLRGARVFREIFDLGEDGVMEAMEREFGSDPGDLHDAKEIAMRALRAAGVPAKVVWNTFEAPERMRFSRARRRDGGGSV
ncbi:hypothetical protein WMF18_29485 [Sorangium sp. So ce315]|uniref:hypothetical protein n=1 Tax=Sorangium sp. So ce315 TaxID=3133299 RepID=UPI003F618B24